MLFGSPSINIAVAKLTTVNICEYVPYSAKDLNLDNSIAESIDIIMLNTLLIDKIVASFETFDFLLTFNTFSN